VAVNFSHERQRVSVPLPQRGEWHEAQTGAIFHAHQTIDWELDACSGVVFLFGVS
jgi:hypothetical protein